MQKVWFKEENIAPKTDGKVKVLKVSCEGHKSETFMTEQEILDYTGFSTLTRLS